MSSCCGGKCGCGSSCACGSGCKGCGKYPDLSETGYYSTSDTFIVGVSPTKLEFEESGIAEGGENGGCKCGPNCACNPCTCK